MLKNKNAIITGCNRGIGRSILEIFAKNQADIYACCRKENSDFTKLITDIKKKYKINIEPIYFDFANEDEMLAGFDKIKSFKNKIDILVNNAGVIHTSIFEMSSLKKFREIYEINFFSQIKFIQLVLKIINKDQFSSIINISSSSAEDSNFGRSIYSASKASIESLTKTLSSELSRYKIRVNAIAPGLTKTDMMTKNTSQDIVKKLEENNPLGRLGDPIDVANVTLFLASNLSSYVNGEIIRVDGGQKYNEQFR